HPPRSGEGERLRPPPSKRGKGSRGVGSPPPLSASGSVPTPSGSPGGVGRLVDGQGPAAARSCTMARGGERTTRRGTEAMAAPAENPAKDPYMPPLVKIGDLIAPRAPQDIPSAGLEDTALPDLVVKLAYSVARFTTEWVGKQLHLGPALTQVLLEKLAFEGL